MFITYIRHNVITSSIKYLNRDSSEEDFNNHMLITDIHQTVIASTIKYINGNLNQESSEEDITKANLRHTQQHVPRRRVRLTSLSGLHVTFVEGTYGASVG